MENKDQYIDFRAVKLLDGSLLHVGSKFPACPSSEELWILDRISFDSQVTRMLILEFSGKEGASMTRHYPLSSIDFLGGCSL